MYDHINCLYTFYTTFSCQNCRIIQNVAFVELSNQEMLKIILIYYTQFMGENCQCEILHNYAH